MNAALIPSKLRGLAIAAVMGAAAMAMSAPANATAVNFGNYELSGAQTADLGQINFSAAPSNLSISFDYYEPVSDMSWASDLQVVITDPNANIFTIGGFTNSDIANQLWSFQGSGSTGNGFYSSSFASASFPAGFGIVAGNYSVQITDNWNTDPNPNQYNNFTISDAALTGPVSNAVPEPGTLALFGLGMLGLGLAQRRQKTA